MNLTEKLRDARAMDEWVDSRAFEIYRRISEDLKSYYLSMANTSEYNAVVAANRCAAIDELTSALLAVRNTPEQSENAPVEPRPAPERKVIRGSPQVIG